MKTVIQPYGTTEEADAYTGPLGQITLDITRMEFRLHDGVTQGGVRIAGIEQLLTIFRASSEDPLGEGLPETGLGLLVRTGEAQYTIRELAVGDGLEVTHPAGQGGDPTVATTFASVAETKTGTETAKSLNPADLKAITDILLKEVLSFVFDYPTDGTYLVILKSPHKLKINTMTTKSVAGTASVKGTIDGVDLGGTANSVSTSEQEQSHASANILAAGADFALVFSSVSGVTRMTVTIGAEKVIE